MATQTNPFTQQSTTVRDDDQQTSSQKTTFIQPTSETDVSKGTSSLATPTTQAEAQQLTTLSAGTSKRRKRSTKSTFIQPMSEADTSKGTSSLQTPTQQTPTQTQPSKQQQITEQARRISREETINITPDVILPLEPSKGILTPPTKEKIRTGLSVNKQAGEKATRSFGEETITLEQKVFLPTGLDAPQIGTISSASLLDIEGVKGAQKEERLEKAQEGLLGIGTKPTIQDIKTTPKLLFEGAKEFGKGALASLNLLKVAEGLISTSASILSGEKTFEEVRTEISQATIDKPAQALGGTLGPVGIGSVAGKLARLAKPKPTIISQKGKIVATESTAFPDKTTFVETVDVVQIKTGADTITAKIKGKGTVKPEIDNILLGTQQREITFIDPKGKQIGKPTVERVDFNIQDIDGTIRAEGTTLTLDPQTGKLIAGKFQASRVGLPDESFLNRIIGGSKKTKIKGDPLDINVATQVDIKNIKPSTESLGFQKQQFEITQPKTVELEIIPGVKVVKEATFKKSVDLTSTEGVTTKISQFEKDFIKRTSDVVEVAKLTKTDPALGRILVQDDSAFFAQSVLRKRPVPKPKPAPTAQQTVTVQKGVTKQKTPLTAIPTSQVLKILPVSETSALGFGPVGTITTIFLEPRLESPSPVISPQIKQGPTSAQLQREFIPPSFTPEELRPTIVQQVQITPPKLTAKSKTKQATKTKQDTQTKQATKQITEQSLVQETKQATKQALKQQTKQATKQTLVQQTLLRTQALSRGLTTPLTIFPVAEIKTGFKTSAIQTSFDVIIGRKGKKVFKQEKARTLEEAIKKAKKGVKTTAAASLEIRRDGQALTTEEEALIEKSLGKQFRRGAKGKKFIQKREFRISDPGEKREITQLGILSSKRKINTKNKQTNDQLNNLVNKGMKLRDIRRML